MIINSRNGKSTNENEYIDIYNDTVIAFIVGNEKIPMSNIPYIGVSDLHYLQFGDMLYIKKKIEDDIEFIYIIKQDLVNGALKVVDVWTTIIVPQFHPLEKYMQWSAYSDRYNIDNNLKDFLQPLSFCINVDSLVEQVMDRLCKIESYTGIRKPSKKEIKSVEVVYNDVVYPNFVEFCTAYKLKYKTAWGKYHRGMSLEDIIASSKSKTAMKTKNTPRTSILRMSKMYDISYGTLWEKVRKKGMSMEDALKGVKLRNEKQVDKE